MGDPSLGLNSFYRTDSTEQTEIVAAEFARKLVNGDIVLLSGDLGTGKTTFVRAAMQAQGCLDLVTSPTFVIGYLYEGTKGRLAHLDLYRFNDPDSEDPTLLAEFFQADTITFIEWPEQVGDSGLLPNFDRVHSVKMSHLGKDSRKIEIESEIE